MARPNKKKTAVVQECLQAAEVMINPPRRAPVAVKPAKPARRVTDLPEPMKKQLAEQQAELREARQM